MADRKLCRCSHCRAYVYADIYIYRAYVCRHLHMYRATPCARRCAFTARRWSRNWSTSSASTARRWMPWIGAVRRRFWRAARMQSLRCGRQRGRRSARQRDVGAQLFEGPWRPRELAAFIRRPAIMLGYPGERTASVVWWTSARKKGCVVPAWCAQCVRRNSARGTRVSSYRAFMFFICSVSCAGCLSAGVAPCADST